MIGNINFNSSKEIVSRMLTALERGEVPIDLPWADKSFQNGVLYLLGKFRGYKTDADKLSVVKEVFGGNKT